MNLISETNLDDALQPRIAANDYLSRAMRLHANQSKVNTPGQASGGESFTLCDKSSGEVTKFFRVLESSTERAELEHYIGTIFQKAHNAQLNGFLPELFKIVAPHSNPAAAVGIRRIDSGKTFLEQYLDSPIEQNVSKIAGRPVSRRQLVEVGNLAASCLGSSRKLITFLVFYLANQGYSWAVCTAVNSVRAALKRSSVNFETICQADPERLGSAKQQWGSYYDNNPSVVVVDLHTALLNIQNRFTYLEKQVS